MRMDPFKILLMITIISSSRAANPFIKDTTTCSQRRVDPEVNKYEFYLTKDNIWTLKWETDDRYHMEARNWAWERVSRFVRMLQDWKGLQKEHPRWILLGGKADVHDKPSSGKNPKINDTDVRPQYCTTQRAHAVQAKIVFRDGSADRCLLPKTGMSILTVS